MKKSELRIIIKEELQRLREDTLITADDKSYLDQIVNLVKSNTEITSRKQFTDIVIMMLKRKIKDNSGLVRTRFERIYKSILSDYRKGKYLNIDESVIKEDTSGIDFVSLDIPLLIRLLEYAREDAKTDMDLHNVATNLLNLSKGKKVGESLSMEHYEDIIKNK